MEKDIWFIDDDDVFRFIIKKHIAGTEYERRVKLFDDGDLAILDVVRLSREGKQLPKLVFLDLNMKHLEGWQALDLLNEFERPTNVVILTSSLSVKDKARAEKEPLVVDFLVKPVDKLALLKAIETHLNGNGNYVIPDNN